MKKHFQEYRNLHLGTKLYKRHYIGQYLEIAKILAKIWMDTWIIDFINANLKYVHAAASTPQLYAETFFSCISK